MVGGICCLAISSPEQYRSALSRECHPSSSSWLRVHMCMWKRVQGFSPPFHFLLKDNWRKSQSKEQLAGYTNGFREGSPRGMYTSLLTKWQPAKRFTKRILADGLLLPITKDRCNSKQKIHKRLLLRNSVIIKQKSPLSACVLLAFVQMEL